MKLFVVLCLCIGHTLAWKPIVNAGHADTFSTSFTVQQSHPDLSGIGSKQSLFADESTLSSELILNSKQTTKPFTFKYGPDDYFGNSYGDVQTTDSREDSCALQKYAFNADGIVTYENAHLTQLQQFTICFWMRFTNHSGDHVPLTYSVDKEQREIQFWIANSNKSSFISMAIKGQQIYRLNYPLRTKQWHHICSSWNGKTGEWQVWLKAERIGRGFHNSLVGHKIPANGKLYSGGPSITGAITEGLHFEITLVQIYKVALSAGKAHRDHKHHHAHRFDHEGQELLATTKSPPAINRPLPMNSLLANGQIPTRVRINLAQPNLQNIVGGGPTQNLLQYDENSGSEQPLTIHTNFVNGQINSGSRLIAQQLIGLQSAAAVASPLRQETIQNTQIHKFNNNPANVQYVDESETKIFFKREATKKQPKQDNKKRKQRGLIFLKDGGIVDDGLSRDADYNIEGLIEFGGEQFKNEQQLLHAAGSLTANKDNIEEQIAEHDREPAEEEVKAVMSLCRSCDIEPFEGAIVVAWKYVQAVPDNALKGYSVGGCGNF